MLDSVAPSGRRRRGRGARCQIVHGVSAGAGHFRGTRQCTRFFSVGKTHRGGCVRARSPSGSRDSWFRLRLPHFGLQGSHICFRPRPPEHSPREEVVVCHLATCAGAQRDVFVRAAQLASGRSALSPKSLDTHVGHHQIHAAERPPPSVSCPGGGSGGPTSARWRRPAWAAGSWPGEAPAGSPVEPAPGMSVAGRRGRHRGARVASGLLGTAAERWSRFRWRRRPTRSSPCALWASLQVGVELRIGDRLRRARTFRGPTRSPW